MGLDICVRKIIKNKEKEYDYFRLIDNNGNYDRRGFPDWTKDFENEITESWYNWKLYKKQTGIDVSQCEWQGEEYSENGSFAELWPKEAGKCPDSADFKTGENSYDWDKYEAIREKYMIKIDLDKVPTYKKSIKVLFYKEVGYQRKGLNSKFYQDYEEEKIGYFVWSKAELERYKRDYCDEPYEYVYPNGKKSGSIIYPKDNFQKNIINNFSEGEDCVIFSW